MMMMMIIYQVEKPPEVSVFRFAVSLNSEDKRRFFMLDFLRLCFCIMCSLLGEQILFL